MFFLASRCFSPLPRFLNSSPLRSPFGCFQAAKLREQLRDKGEQLVEAERRAAGLQEELDSKGSGTRRAVADKEAAEAAAAEAAVKLRGAEALAGERGERLASAEAEVERAGAELKRLQRLLRAAEDDGAAAAKESSEANPSPQSLPSDDDPLRLMPPVPSLYCPSLVSAFIRFLLPRPLGHSTFCPTSLARYLSPWVCPLHSSPPLHGLRGKS